MNHINFIATLFLSAFCCLHSMSQSKKDLLVLNIDEINDGTYTMDSLETFYKAGPQVFEDIVQYSSAYKQLMGNLAPYLLEAGIQEDNQLRLFNRMYFNADGEVEIWLFKILEGDKQQGGKIKDAFENFAKKEKFSLSASENFSQCSPVTIQL